MAKVTVKLPAEMTTEDGRREIECDAATVAEALEVFAEAGAAVDRDSRRVRLSAELVQAALRTLPRTFTLCARDPQLDLPLAPDTSYMTTDGCGTEVIDRATSQRRPSTKADLVELTRLQDYLGSIQFWWPTVGAGELGETAHVYEIEVGLDWTEKHLMGMVQGDTFLLISCSDQ